MRRGALCRARAVIGIGAEIRASLLRLGGQQLAVLDSRSLGQSVDGLRQVVDHPVPPSRRCTALVAIEQRDDEALRPGRGAAPLQFGRLVTTAAAKGLRGVDLRNADGEPRIGTYKHEM